LAGETRRIAAYDDALHAENPEDLRTGECGYKYRLLDGLVVPPYVTPGRYAHARAFEMRPDDVCYVSYPKSGSTWLAHIIFLILHDGESPAEGTLRSQLHWLESSWTYPRSPDDLEQLPSPRIFKSHMPYRMALGGGPDRSRGRFIYIARNPKDVAVSYYHFERAKAWSGHYDGSWAHWLEMLTNGRVQRGDWFDHVLGWWNSRQLGNLLFLKYEDLLRYFPAQLRRLVGFLGVDPDERTLDKIEQLTRFDAMKTDRFANMHEIEDFEGFFREGRVGSWRDQFTAQQDAWFSQVIAERLAGSGLDFDYE
jgi:hypothetical protein